MSLPTATQKTAIALATLILLAGCVKTDLASVRTFVQEEIQTQFPHAKIEEVGDTELVVFHKDGNRQMIDVAPVQEGCKRVPRSCGQLVGRLLVVMQEAITAQAAPPVLSNVVPILSSPSVAKSLVQQNASSPVFVQPLTENIGVVFAAFSDGLVTYLDEKAVAQLGLTPENLLKESIKNVESLATVTAVAFPGEAAVYQATGNFVAGGILSRVHADKLKAQLKCSELAVAFPRRGMTLVANFDDANAVSRLREISARFLNPPSAAISGEVYRLSGGGLALMKR
ncbi:MAG: hypothetical protein ABL931_07405 [Usitatibacteraceae bacterium]